MTTPSSILSRAADLIRDTAAAATPGPWKPGVNFTFVAPLRDFTRQALDHNAIVAEDKANAAWASLLSPDVAPMIEYWLRTVAEHCERPGGNHYPTGCQVCAPALKLSRAVLGVKEGNDA